MKSHSERMLDLVRANTRRLARLEIAKCNRLCDDIDLKLRGLKKLGGERVPVSAYLCLVVDNEGHRK